MDMKPMDIMEPYLELIDDTELRDDIREYLSLYAEDILKFPASLKYHHTWRGGLWDHIVEAIGLGLAMAEHLENNYMVNINTDVIVASLLIHDTGKVVIEYGEDIQARLFYYKSKEIRMDHAIFPILDFGEKLGRPLRTDVAIAVMAHMGGWGKTSVECDPLEAAIVHSADLVSARLGKVDQYEGRGITGSRTKDPI